MLTVRHLEEEQSGSDVAQNPRADSLTGVAHLQAADDLLQRQHALRAADEGGGGQPEHLVQVRLVQAVEAYTSHDAPRHSAGGQATVQVVEEEEEEEQAGCFFLFFLGGVGKKKQKLGGEKRSEEVRERRTDRQTEGWTQGGNMQAGMISRE